MSGIFPGLAGLGEADDAAHVGEPLGMFNAVMSALWDNLLVARMRIPAHAKPAFDEDMVAMNSLAAQVRAGDRGKVSQAAKLARRFVNAASRTDASNVAALADAARTLERLTDPAAGFAGFGAGPVKIISLDTMESTLDPTDASSAGRGALVEGDPGWLPWNPAEAAPRATSSSLVKTGILGLLLLAAYGALQ